MSNLEKRTGNAEVGQASSDNVDERKAAARALRPVRNDPQAATRPSDFVKQQIMEIDADGNDITPAPQATTPVEGVEGEIAQKNADADKKRAAHELAGAVSLGVELQEKLEATVDNANTLIAAKDEEISQLKADLEHVNTTLDNSVINAEAKIKELEHKLDTIEGIADDDDDKSGKEDADAPTAAEVAATKKADATAKAKASAKKN